ncbi:hypothetical protein B1A99_20515 [Cohnella sp. CIP 111063]|uniref:hypothetical protein n=1 Tax=unclassified Cohnella TaxID=2636738 RepID=UPI000B8C27E7|nr:MULTISPECIES: hypothetical protein [unclassified Cohnella]OXS56157.1 hypothetical protein B1A99_20515 [Cohnella sp. CIP 111063]PRX67791.1 hypothetical protein B0G52_11410 [Cohnella sp. SGD-V74]
MTVKYQIAFSESDVFVLEKGGEFHLTICSRVNPLGFGNQLAVYSKFGEAVDAAEKFCKLYELTRQYGYHLKGSSFLKEDCEPLFVPALLEDDTTVDTLRAALEADKVPHEASG